jgi:DNA-directed RNA polymerase I, II, and III subunit RPABC2
MSKDLLYEADDPVEDENEDFEEDFEEPIIVFDPESDYDSEKITPYSSIITDEFLRIPSDKRTTRNILSKYERVRILSERAECLARGANSEIKKTKEMTYGDQAKEELRQKKLNLIIRRYLPNGQFEDWNLYELATQPVL